MRYINLLLTLTMTLMRFAACRYKVTKLPIIMIFDVSYTSLLNKD